METHGEAHSRRLSCFLNFWSVLFHAVHDRLMHGAVEAAAVERRCNLLEVDSERDKSLLDCVLYKHLAYIAVMEVKLLQLNCELKPTSRVSSS